MNNIQNPRHAYVISDIEQYADLTANASSSTTTTTQSLLTSITAVLAAVPQQSTPSYNNGAVQWKQRILLNRIEIRYRLIGAQATALVAADIFNNVRLLVWETRDSHLVSVANNPLTGVDDPLNVSDVRMIHYDSVIPLCSHAFDSADTNVPDVKTRTVVIPINRMFDFFTTVAAGTSGWDTKVGNIRVSHVSDSSVSPHPTVITTARLYYELVRPTSRRDGQ